VVGQDHVVQSLRNAIRLNRIAQAYLFSGTRGVGKTSMARIFAKCLNCVNGPTENPCLECDICRAIAQGQDVDVIEIDGASNNGVEQVRELRQNVALRPSRARYKIYYIDEVHMLSTGAFNALLKTLEEPPPHVKFFFATTEPNKIPITVLSRCQKYDFAGITPESIVTSLGEICARENVEAEPEALQVVARRASGSMRDAQSLLEQLLSSGHAKLTVEVVHGLLGTASDERLLDMIDALADHDAATALGLLDKAASEGVQPSELLGGLLEFLRDAMVLAAGADSLLLAVTPRQRPRLKKVIDRWPLDTVMTALQILAEARSRMRGSPHGRIIVEVALVKVARLENFAELGEIIQHLASVERGGGGMIAAPPRPGPTTGSPAPPSLKKKPIADELSVPGGLPDLADPPRQTSPGIGDRSGTGETPPATPSASLDAIASEPLDIAEVRHAWPELIKKVGPNIAWRLSLMEPVEIEGPDVLVISPKPGYNGTDDLLEAPGAREKIEQTLRRLVRRHISVRYEPGQDRPGRTAEPAESVGKPRGADVLSSDPLVRKVVELFEARPFHLDLEAEGED
jgi:DNA polymerase-3 subunit gamma/tau